MLEEKQKKIEDTIRIVNCSAGNSYKPLQSFNKLCSTQKYEEKPKDMVLVPERQTLSK